MAEIETTADDREFLKGFWARASQTVAVVAESYIVAQTDAWVEGFLATTAKVDRVATSFLIAQPDQIDA